jgi:hypothetical protein
MRQPEPLPPFFQKLIGIGYRILAGAVLGFGCAIVILIAREILWGDVSVENNVWQVVYTRGGAVLGAIYYPLAWLTLLEKENQVPATIAVCLPTIFLGLVGYSFGGPGITAIGASVGFWGTCASIYQRRKRDRNRADFGSYFR